MKHLKEFEKFSKDDLDKILDKINDQGMDSLTPEEKYYLENDGETLKENLIKHIQKKVREYGGYLTMNDLQSDFSPIYKEINNEIHLVGKLIYNTVVIVVYGGYKYNTELYEYDIPYEKLNYETLEDINVLLNDAIKNELIEKDI